MAVLLPEPLASEVDQVLSDGRFVDAVRLIRQRTGLNLLPATLAVRHRREACARHRRERYMLATGWGLLALGLVVTIVTMATAAEANRRLPLKLAGLAVGLAGIALLLLARP